MFVEPLCIFLVESHERVQGGLAFTSSRDTLSSTWRSNQLIAFTASGDISTRFPEPPIPGVDDEIVNTPVRIVDHKILDMADFAVDGVNTVSGHFDDAAQMRIGSPQSRAVAASLGLVGWTQAQIGRPAP